MSTSTMDNYSIAPISFEDLSTIASFLYASKGFLTINRLLYKDWPNEAAQMSVYKRTVEGSFADPSLETFKVVHNETNEIVGHVVLSRIHAKPEGNGDEGHDEKSPDFFNAEVKTAVEENVKEIYHAVDGIERFEVTHIFVVNAHRNKGVGSQLVKLCIDKAKAQGLSLAVISEPAAHAFFSKLGFEDTKHADIDLRKWSPDYCGFGLFRLWGMVLKI